MASACSAVHIFRYHGETYGNVDVGAYSRMPFFRRNSMNGGQVMQGVTFVEAYGYTPLSLPPAQCDPGSSRLGEPSDEGGCKGPLLFKGGDERVGFGGIDGHEQAARGLGVGGDELLGLANGALDEQGFFHVGEVAPCASGDGSLSGQFFGTGQEGQAFVYDTGLDPAGLAHLQQMAQESEASDIGHGVYTHLGGSFGGGPVQGNHRGGGCFDGVVRGCAVLESGSNKACAERFGEDQYITGLGAAVADEAVFGDGARDHQAILWLLIIDGMAAEDGDAGLPGLGLAPCENPGQLLQGELVAGEANDIQGKQRRGPHGVNIGEGIGRGDLAELVGVVDDGGEEIDALDENPAIGQAVCGGVVGVFVADEDIGIGFPLG